MLLRVTSCAIIGLLAGIATALTIHSAPELPLMLQLDWIGLHGLFGLLGGAVFSFIGSLPRVSPRVREVTHY